MSNVFICGCPRSGTTALWRLVSSNPEIAIGLERYINRCSPTFKLSEELFEKKRFFTVKKGDSHFKTLGDNPYARHYYKHLEPRFEDCRVFGDKVPILYKFYPNIFDKFPEAKIIFIYRNVFDVAQSFKKRYENKGDKGWNMDCSDAVEEWNQSLLNTYNLMKENEAKEPKIHLVNYEELFYDKLDINRVFEFTGVRPVAQSWEVYKKLLIEGEKAEQKRDNYLTSKEKRMIMQNSRFDIYRKIVELDRKRKQIVLKA